TDAAAAGRRPRPEEAVAVSIDILDEDHSFELVMRCLVTDAALRASLGRAARRHYEAHHTLARMADDYQRLLAQAITLPTPDPASIALPEHLLDDHSGRLRRLLAETGLDSSPF